MYGFKVWYLCIYGFKLPIKKQCPLQKLKSITVSLIMAKSQPSLLTSSPNLLFTIDDLQ